MRFILAGVLAATVVWVINRYYLSQLGEKSIIYLVPLLEEVVKSGFALTFDTSLFYTHAVFGTIEAITDIYSGAKQGISAGWVSYLGHMIFGLLSTYGAIRYQGFLAAVLPGYLAHMVWNAFVIRVVVKQGRSRV